MRSRVLRAAALATTICALTAIAVAAPSPPATSASLQIVHDPRGDSKSQVPGNDIIRTTAQLTNGVFRFTITNVRIPQGLFPPTIDIRYHAGVGNGGQAVLQTSHHTYRIHRHFSGNTVVYSFKRKLLGRIDEKYLQWRATLYEGPPSDLAPDHGYARLRVR